MREDTDMTMTTRHRRRTPPAPPYALWVDDLGRVTCPAHAGPEAWAAMLDAPTASTVGRWQRLPAAAVDLVERVAGAPACDECRRALRWPA